MSLLTWSFVAFEAVTGRSRQPSQTGIGVVARQDVRACRGGSPISSVDREHFHGDVPAEARTVLQHLRTRWDQRRIFEDTIARSLASVADGIVEIIRLPQKR